MDGPRTKAANGLVALVTGGSRGVGAATVQALAAHGFAVVLTFRNKANRAADVVAEATRQGASAVAVGCDLTRPAEVERLMATVAAWGQRLDLLVLNASGGLERDLVAADPSYPMRINHDAQLRLLDQALPIMPAGAVVVFVTSHWAHLYGKVEQLPAYTPVAASKHAGEQALRARQPDLAARGTRLLVVTGDLIEGTITPKLLERRAPGLARQRRGEVGALPTTGEMAAAIVRAALDASLPSGSTIIVGGALASVAQGSQR